MSTEPQPAPTAEAATGSRLSSVTPRLLRTRAAAHYLGLGEKAVRSLVLRGELRVVQLKPGNSPFLLDVRDLDRFIESHKTLFGG